MSISNDEVVRLFTRYLASNRDSRDLGLDAAGLSSSRSVLRFRLIFRAGRDYCCQEPGCHLGLMTDASWNLLTALADDADLDLSPSFRVEVRMHTEAGATFAQSRAVGILAAADAHTSDHVFRPPGPRARYDRNAPGDFYVEADCCTLCGVPVLEAPELFAEDSEQCYVSCQPQTPAALDRMLHTIRLADQGCIRYAGDDPAVVKALHDAGEMSAVDRVSSRRSSGR
jgi:hypothetical protein